MKVKTRLSPVLFVPTALDATVAERLDEQRVRASVEGRECNIYVNFAVEPAKN